jgi:hypothetical protein
VLVATPSSTGQRLGVLGSVTMLRLLARWPTRDDLAVACRQDLVEFARAARHGWPERFADNILTALARPSRRFDPRWCGPRAQGSGWANS